MKNGTFFTKILFLSFACFLTMACKRAVEKSSSISIQIPDMHGSQKNLSTLSFPSGTLCFIANVTGSGIDPTKDACFPEIGKTSEFGQPGTLLVLEDVPTGENRKFEIFMYLSKDSSCPGADLDSLKKLDYSRLYLVGTKIDVPLLNKDETVEISVAFPGTANSLLPTYTALGCSGNSTPNPTANSGLNPRANMGGGLMTGGSFKLNSSIGNPVAGNDMVGGSYKIKVK